MTDKHFTSAEVDAKSFNDDERSFTAWASRPTIDRDNEVIEANAWDLVNYNKNPVILWVHDYYKPPVGRALWTKVEKEGLLFKPAFADTDMGNELYQLYKQGVLHAFSVGFSMKEWIDADDADKPSRTYTDVELLEISCVPVPACPDALVAHYESGNIKTKGLKQAVEAVLPRDDEELVIEKKIVTIEKEGRVLSSKLRKQFAGMSQELKGMGDQAIELSNDIDNLLEATERVADDEAEEETEGKSKSLTVKDIQDMLNSMLPEQAVDDDAGAEEEGKSPLNMDEILEIMGEIHKEKQAKKPAKVTARDLLESAKGRVV